MTQKCSLEEEIQISQPVFFPRHFLPIFLFWTDSNRSMNPSPVTVYKDKPIDNIWQNPEALKNSCLLFPTECIHIPIKYIHGPLWKAWENPWQRLWIIILSVYTHVAFRSQDVPPTAPVVKVGSHSMLDPRTIHAHWSLTLYDLYLNLCLTHLCPWLLRVYFGSQDFPQSRAVCSENVSYSWFIWLFPHDPTAFK